jgi:type II secretion system protein N
MNRPAVVRSTVYVALFLFFTILFMPVNYPSERLTGQVNGWMSAASNGALTIGNARIKPPLSLKLENVTLEAGQGRSLDVGEVVIGLRLLGLLSGKKGADVRLENPWLNSRLTVISSGDSWHLDIRSMEIDLSELPDDIMALPLDLDGKINLSLDLQTDDPAQGVSSGEIRITSGPIEVGGELLETLGLTPLRISRILSIATVEENVVELGENAVEGDLTASARGVIRIAPVNYMASRLDLTVQLKLAPGNRERLMPVLKMMGARPKADGTVNLRIRGTVGEPSITM